MDCPVCKNPLFGPHPAATDRSKDRILYYFCQSPRSKCRLSGQRFDLLGNLVEASLIEDAVNATREDEP